MLTRCRTPSGNSGRPHLISSMPGSGSGGWSQSRTSSSSWHRAAMAAKSSMSSVLRMPFRLRTCVRPWM